MTIYLLLFKARHCSWFLIFKTQQQRVWFRYPWGSRRCCQVTAYISDDYQSLITLWKIFELNKIPIQWKYNIDKKMLRSLYALKTCVRWQRGRRPWGCGVARWERWGTIWDRHRGCSRRHNNRRSANARLRGTSRTKIFAGTWHNSSTMSSFIYFKLNDHLYIVLFLNVRDGI